MMNREKIAQIKKSYPPGTRVELISMEGESKMPSGLEGTVTIVDDIGQIHVDWDNGSTLALVPETDSYRKLPEQAQTTELGMNYKI